MAEGGRNGDSSDDGLDLREIEFELRALEEAELDTTNESLFWEDHKAQTEYEKLEAETSGEFNFPGFHTQTTTPTKNNSSKLKSIANLSVPTSTPKTPHVHIDWCCRSTPTSPLRNWSSLNIQQRISSFENLSKALNKQKSGAKSKTKSKASPKTKKSTRSTLKKGQVSPLAKATALLKKRTRAKRYLGPVNTMDQANVAQAGRLNPRNRRAGGVGDTVATLHFPVLSTESIPPAGKNVLREFVSLRENIVADANLVLADVGDATACKESLSDYLAIVANCRERFNKVMESIVDDNANAEAAINEIIKIERELQGLMKACKIRIANRLAPGAPGVQVKLERLSFPEFDGSGNYKTWKTNFDGLAVHVESEQTKKSHLLKALIGNAKTYINSTMTPTSTFDDIITLLNSRYNDPLSVNYNLLHRVFNSPDLAKPQSTQAHWDSAVGDIKAIQESGLGISEVLVYYRLHKFQPDIVRRVKDLHKIKYPGGVSINLDEAIEIMNKITAEEATLTEDTISVEQSIQNLTLTATPKVIQYTNSTSQRQSHSTYVPQTEGRSLPQADAISKGGNRGGKGWSNNSGNNTPNFNSETSQNKSSSKQPYCFMCETHDHVSFQCPNFTTPSSKRQELSRKNRCPNCTFKTKFMSSHQCFYHIKCTQCGGSHKRWLCTKKNISNDVTQDDSSPNK